MLEPTRHLPPLMLSQDSPLDTRGHLPQLLSAKLQQQQQQPMHLLLPELTHMQPRQPTSSI